VSHHTTPPLLQSFKALDLPFYPLELEALRGFEGGDLDQHFHQGDLISPFISLRDLLLLGFFGTLPGRSRPLAQYLCVRAWWPIGASNSVVELAPILCVKVWCHLQVHRLVERELAFVACSPENRVSLCGVGVLHGITPIQHRRTSRNKEETMGIHPCVFVSPLRLPLSFNCIFTCLVSRRKVPIYHGKKYGKRFVFRG
jgi:hypothetical protein